MNGKFQVQRDACYRKINEKIIAFLSSVVYYSGDLLKSTNMAFARHKTFISLYFDFFSSSLLILGDFKVTRCVLVDIITSSSVLQLRLLPTRNSALSLESKYQQLYQTKNCATIPKIKLKQCCRCHLPPSNIFMQNFYRNGKFHVQRCMQAKNRWENRSVSFCCHLLLLIFAKISKEGFCAEQNIYQSLI